MPSLKCMFLDKWLHKGQISQEEYDAVIKKLDGHDKQVREEAYAKGASDMEQAKQIIIDALLKQLKEIKSLLPMCDQYDEYDCSLSKDECFECMGQTLDKIKEQLKKQMQKGEEE